MIRRTLDAAVLVIALALASCGKRDAAVMTGDDSGDATADSSTSDASTADAAPFRVRAPLASHARAIDKEGRTHGSRVARLEKVIAIARGRKDARLSARARSALDVEHERHARCMGRLGIDAPAPRTSDASTLDATTFDCDAYLDDGTSPWDARAIAATVTTSNAEAVLGEIEAELAAAGAR